MNGGGSKARNPVDGATERGVSRRASLLHRTLLFFGIAISVGSIAFVSAQATRNWGEIASINLSSDQLPLIILAGFFYLLSIAFASGSWAFVLRRISSDVESKRAFAIHMVAQLGKYLPGNIGHFVGRAALGKSMGARLKATSISSAIEIACALIAASGMFAASFLLFPASSARAFLFLPPGSATYLSLPVTFLLAALSVLLARRVANKATSRVLSARNWFRAIVLNGTSLLMAAASFGVFLASFPEAGGQEFGLAVLVFLLAWLVGFLAPGAPAGIGVREAILLAFLSPTVGAGLAISVSILHRLFCVVLDVIAFFAAAGWLLSNKHPFESE